MSSLTLHIRPAELRIIASALMAGPKIPKTAADAVKAREDAKRKKPTKKKAG